MLDISTLFTDLGKLVKSANLYRSDAVDAATRRDEIVAQFEDSDQQVAVSPIYSLTTSAQQAVSSTQQNLVAIATRRLQDQTTVIDELRLPNNNLSGVLTALINEIVSQADSVDASTVTVGSVTAGSGNVGNGTAIVSKVLDGATSPGSGLTAQKAYSGWDSQLSLSETVVLTCTLDTYTNRVTSGQESFSVTGAPAVTDKWGTDDGGSGTGSTIRTVNSASLITNGDFETFTSNVPSSWTIDSGTAGTHVFREATQVYRGTYGLKLLGTGAQATIQLSQAAPVSQLTPLKRYLVSFRYKASAVDTIAQALKVYFTGTGYTAAVSEKVQVTGDLFATSWEHACFWINIPANLPSDFTLNIIADGQLSNGKIIYIDSMQMQEAQYINGVAIAVIAGSTPFVRGDTFTFTLANDDAGTFQRYFRRAYGIQLPSNAAGAETIADSLAL